MLDAVAAKTGSRGETFDTFLTMSVCALAGGTMEDEYLAAIQKYVTGEKGKRPVDQLAAAFGKLVDIMTETRADILGDLFKRENLQIALGSLNQIDKMGKRAKVNTR